MSADLQAPAVEVEVLAAGLLYPAIGGELLPAWVVEITVEYTIGKLHTTRYTVVRRDSGFDFIKAGTLPGDAYYVQVRDGRAAGCGCMDRSCRKAFKPACKHLVAANHLLSLLEASEIPA